MHFVNITILRRACFLGAVLLAFVGVAKGGIDLVVVEKSQRYQQVKNETRIMHYYEPDASYDGGAYGFEVNVEGSGLSSLTAPVLSLPTGSAFPSQYSDTFNGGVLNYSSEDDSWSLGNHNWGDISQANVDTLFANGVYSINVAGTTVSLNLTGDVYPSPLKATLTGGTWANDTYVISPDQPLSITVAPYVGYGSHLEDRIAINVELGNGGDEVESFHSQNPSGNPISYTLPANTLGNGQTLWVELQGNVIVDTDDALDGPIQAAVYTTLTKIKVQASASGTISPPPDSTNTEPTVWKLNGYFIEDEGPYDATSSSAVRVSGTATVTETLPGLVYNVSLSVPGVIDYSVDLQPNGDLFSARYITTPYVDEIDHAQVMLRVVDSDTMYLSVGSLTTSRSDINTRKFFGGYNVVLTRAALPSVDVSTIAGVYSTNVSNLGFETEYDQEYLSSYFEQPADGVVSATLSPLSSTAYRLSLAAPDDNSSLDLQVMNGGLGSEDNDSSAVDYYNDGDWHWENVRTTRNQYVIPLGNDRAFAIKYELQIAQLLPVNPEAHPGYVPYSNMYYGKTSATMITKTSDLPPSSGYASWTNVLGLTGDNGAPGATPFGDGLPNLMRYAMNLGASVTSGDLPRVQLQKINGVDNLTLKFRMRKSMTDAVVTVMSSEDLKSWSPVAEGYITQIQDLDADTALYQASIPLETHARLFVRLEANTIP